MKASIISFIAILTMISVVQAQEIGQEIDDPVRWSPNGMVVFASTVAFSPQSPQNGFVESVIYRRIGSEGSFEEISRLQRAETFDEFAERGESDLIETFLDESDFENEDELWEFIQQHAYLEDYLFVAFEPDLWRALGLVYTDEETTELTDGTTVYYQVRYVREDGTESDVQVEGSEVVGSEPSILKPRLQTRVEEDSLVGATWESPLPGSEDAFFSRVYIQSDEDEDFRPLNDLLMASHIPEDSTVTYQWRMATEPEVAHKLFIEPIDILGNPGPRSDTLTVISVDFENLPLFGDITAKDTTSGIHLSWKQIPQKPYLTGIEVQRSRDARQNFIVLDTLSIAATEYLDTQLVPNRSYYYEFRVVTMRARTELPSGVASASFESTLPPSPPAGLTAVQENEGIRLNWDSVEEPNLYAYYVYRGTSRYDSLAVVSPAIQDTTTFFDNSEQLSGRTNYVYAVKAVSNNELESDLSNTVAVRPNRIVRPPAPVGIEGYAEQSRVRLFWSDQSERDQAVEGYHLYRSESPMEITPDSAEASIQAEQAGFERINDSLITTTSFDDINVESGQTYYYSLSSVDVFEVESLMSNTARFTPTQPALRPPSQVSVRTVSNGVELRWNETLQDGASGYRIYRRVRGETEPTAIGLNNVEETIFRDENVSGGELYWYSVSVIGEDAESEASSEESVRV
ncbi:MAG: hypothetical protein GVY20_03045, partial [Bacteroidetes bacterium]|nr:hypothetical protein [Bacteroidota bacterium]